MFTVQFVGEERCHFSVNPFARLVDLANYWIKTSVACRELWIVAPTPLHVLKPILNVTLVACKQESTCRSVGFVSLVVRSIWDPVADYSRPGKPRIGVIVITRFPEIGLSNVCGYRAYFICVSEVVDQFRSVRILRVLCVKLGYGKWSTYCESSSASSNIPTRPRIDATI